MEEWGVDPHRLAWANVLDALEHGAQAHNHCEVVDLVRDGAAVIGVRYRGPDGGLIEARSRVVVNATGPWVPQLCGLAGTTVELRPAKGVHIVYDRRISNFSISATGIDGRDIILVQHGGFSILGTTDDDYYGELDRPEVLPDEVEYLLQGFERVFPSIREYRAVRATAGVRPTLADWHKYEDDLSRHHQVFDHEARDGVAGFVTVAGGKLSMYRLMAEETAGLVCRKLELESSPSSADTPLPGSESEATSAAELAASFRIPALAAARLLRRHGCRSESVLEAGRDRHARVSCRCELLTEAELAFAARSEQVRTLGDAFRRVGLASGPCAGAACVERAAEVVGGELGWSAGQRQEAAREFLAELWAGRASVLGPAGWAQEELAYGARRGWR
jgi:glycerol-3-phosphate dehydrogenase